MTNDPEHDPDGRWVARFSDRDEFAHGDLAVVVEQAAEMLEERDYLSGDSTHVVTIGRRWAVEFPERAQRIPEGAE